MAEVKDTPNITTPIEYLDSRIAELQRERPSTEAGRRALRIAIGELERIRLGLKVEAVIQLQTVIREAEAVQ